MIRVLFAFDPWRSAILRTGGDKSGKLELLADIGGHLLKMPTDPAA